VRAQVTNGRTTRRWEMGAGAVDHAPIEAPQWSSASAGNYFQVNDERNMSRRAYAANMAAGDTTEQTRYSDWYYVNGGLVPARPALGAAKSELFTAYAITLDADRCSTPYTNHALNLAQTDLEFEVTRVKSPILGRDLNPLGRGDGTYYCNGGNAALSSLVAVRSAKPRLTGESAIGFGSSVNNQCCGPGIGTGGPFRDDIPWGPYDPTQPPKEYRPLEIPPAESRKPGEIVYFSPLYNHCKGSSSGVCDIWTEPPSRFTSTHACCSDACLKTDAKRAAAIINWACMSDPIPICEAWVVDLPITRQQVIAGYPPYWGVVVGFTCSSSYEMNPLVACWCRYAPIGQLSGVTFQKCLDEELGIEPGCQGGIAPVDITEFAPYGTEGIIECLRGVADKYSSEPGLRLAIDQLIECILVDATWVFALCVASGRSIAQCQPVWRQAVTDCFKQMPGNYAGNIIKEIIACFRGLLNEDQL